MTDEYERRVISVMVNRKGEDIFSDYATTITIIDEAGGEFIEIAQHNELATNGKIRVDENDWVHIREAADYMIKECRK